MRKFVTVQEAIADELHEAIRKGEIKPGQRLYTEEIARDFGVSRMPVREALHKLETKGLVESSPYKGFRVTQLSIEEIEQVFFVRLALEPVATRLAVAKYSDDTAEQLEQLVTEMEACEADATSWIGLDREFHMAIYQAAGNPRLAEIVLNLRDEIERYINTYIGEPGLIEASRDKHRKLLNAYLNRDESLAERFAKEHMRETADIFISHLKVALASKATTMPVGVVDA